MSDPKHTPGPWTGFNGFDIFSGRKIVAAFWTRPSPQDEALILAAPDMLEALKELLSDKMAGESNPDCPDLETVTPRPVTWGVLRRARAAIAKAEGGAA